jgi:hypothetical protein
MIAGWILLMASIAVVYGFQPFYNASLRFAYTGWLAYTLLFWAMQLFTVVLVPLVVQADPAVGTDAFWMTRPIRPALLATSKLLLLLMLLVIVPTASMMVLTAAYHVPASAVMLVGLEMAILQTFWVAVLTVAAVLTGNIARFAVLCGVGLVFIAVTLGIIGAVAAARVATVDATATLELQAAGSMPSFSTWINVDHTPELVAVLVAIAAAAALVLIQYRTRLRRRSVSVGVAGLIVACLAGMSWRRPLLLPPLTPPAWATSAQALQLAVVPGSIRTDPKSPGTPGDRKTWGSTWLQARLTDIQPGWFATATLTDASLQLDAVRLESARRGYPASISSDAGEGHPQAAVLGKLLDVTRLLPPMPPHRESLLGFALSDVEIARYAPAVGQYRGRFRIGLTRAAVIGTLPLQTGATAQDAAYRLVIDSVSTTRWGAGAISARESDATSLFDGRPPPSYTSYLLRNHRTREATAGNAPPDMSGEFFLAGFARPDLLPPRLLFTIHDVASSGFRARSISIMFPWILGMQREDRAAADAWLADAELVIVRMTDAGWVERTLEIPEFPLVPATPPPSRLLQAFGSRQ